MNKKTKHTVALFETEYGGLIVDEVRAKPVKNWIRMSEPIEVEFTHLPVETTLKQKVDAVDALINETKMEAMEKINQLTQKRQELLALTN